MHHQAGYVLDGLEDPLDVVCHMTSTANASTCFPWGGRHYSLQAHLRKKMPGWADSTVGVTSCDALPVQARNYLERIEQVTGVPIAMISTSPDRDHNIFG